MQTSQLRAQADEVTLTATGRTLSIKDDGVTGAKILAGTITASDLAGGVGGTLSELYVGTGYDSAHGPNEAAGNTEEEHELTAIASADLAGATYLIIKILGKVNNGHDTGETAKTELKIQTKETGGAYADKLTYQIVENSSQGGVSFIESETKVIEYYHTLSAGEKTNGVQVKMFSKSTITENAAVTFANFTNIQTSITII